MNTYDRLSKLDEDSERQMMSEYQGRADVKIALRIQERESMDTQSE